MCDTVISLWQRYGGDALSWYPWQSPFYLFIFCFHYANVVTPKPSCALTAALVAPMGVLLLCIFCGGDLRVLLCVRRLEKEHTDTSNKINSKLVWTLF